MVKVFVDYKKIKKEHEEILDWYLPEDVNDELRNIILEIIEKREERGIGYGFEAGYRYGFWLGEAYNREEKKLE